MVIETSAIVGAIATGCIGYLFWSLKRMQTKIDNMVDEREIKEMIQDKLEVEVVHRVMIEKRLDKVEAKLDLILERLPKQGLIKNG